MNPEQHPDENLSFGEQLLGLQGFSAARAARYRAEMEALLVHRITPSERRALGIAAILTGGALTVGGVLLSLIHGRPEHAELDLPRYTVAATCILTGLLLGAWLLRIALQGGYARRRGDVMGLLIALLFAGGWALALVQLALNTTDLALRPRLLCVGGVLFALLAGCLLLALLQRLHRQTQERLLRIEYHLAELLERSHGR